MLMVALAHTLTGAILLGLALSAVYVGFRLAGIAGVRRRWPFVAPIMAVMVGAITFTALAVKSTSPTTGHLYVWFGYGFYLILNLLMVLALAHLAERLSKRPHRLLGGFAIIAAFAITVVGAIRASSFEVKDTSIAVPGLKRPLTLLQISDAHLGHHRGTDYLAKIVAEANRQRPDVVVITGDLMDSQVALRPGVLAPLKGLSAPALYVIGNHEKDMHTPLAMQRVADAGLRILNNQVVEIDGVQFAGLDYMNADEDAFKIHPSTNRATVKSVLPNLKLRRDRPSILLQHGPFGAEYAQDAGVGLVIAGHTHGGQVFPLNLVTPLLFPFDQGVYSLTSSKVFVSPGVGTFMVRARIGTTNQLNLLRLRPK